MKHISLSFALIFSTLSPIFASSGALLDADTQLTRLEELRVGRAPWGAFPELMLHLQDSARVIRARVGVGLHTSFDAAHKELESTKSVGTDSANHGYPGDWVHFSAYNILYDLQGALQEGDVPFTIWNTDGTYNADGMKAVLSTLVEDFRNRHAHAFVKSQA